MRQVEVTTWYLELRDRAQLRPSARAVEGLQLVQSEIVLPELNRFFYTAVGGDWYWTDRLGWSHERWRLELSRPGVETWVAWLRGTPVGYAELVWMPDGSFKVEYLGVIRGFTGSGVGGQLLGFALARGLEGGASRVWVHTCSLDHPGALAAYQARGMAIYKVETESKMLEDQPPGPWPGAWG
jgi:GNAT superfamily N-acetyltransferase